MGERIFIVCGEESGDLHGSSLMSALKSLSPGIEFAGMGGERMRKLGLVGPDSKEVSVVGAIEVIGKLPRIWKTFKTLKAMLVERRFDCVVLIDFPDFNLKFAKEARRLGVPVIYYISPQVWAWRKGRIKTIASLVDKMLVVFPFEEKIYRDAGVDVEYVGHPLLDVVESGVDKAASRKALGLPVESTVVALLPGSRTAEIERLLPPMLKAGEIIAKGLKARPFFVIPAANSIDDGLFVKIIKSASIDVRVVRNSMHKALCAADSAIVASGTATLEAALIGAPMVIIYRMAPVSYAIARALVGVADVGLPNIVAGKRIVAELIQNEATPERMAEETLVILNDKGRRASIEAAYNDVRKALGGRGAAERAAKAVLAAIRA
ncbi:MAG: lipid-A-disaccharide synthase [Deltaproteobacteria bacterium GWC2_56_8]|nr:MAG: lipid-A-disaccharide synthase [Deltaproteobacteria bacterium GWB2_55_19]OGP36524.1 MAG: lipid-A-disaccharide synthase [Deltaproteobacteria bacterium GWC2_56_8]HAO92347.1 lipid-A-disaccharide synthase [Deltaproteobacteria bacterium]